MKKLLIAFFLLINTQAYSQELALRYTTSDDSTPLKILVQPILSKSETIKLYQPLAKYLSKRTGQDFEVVTTNGFQAYWNTVCSIDKYNYDIVLDAAHFTDYKNDKFRYQVIAKIPNTVSHSLVTHQDNVLFGPQELVSKKIATVPSPSLGGVKLAELFPNPVRQPRLARVNNWQAAIDSLKNKKVDAALVPTSMISGDATVFTVETTEPVPHLAVSVNPNIPESLRNKIRRQLIDANGNKDGQALLSKLNIPAFMPSDNKEYEGYAMLLRNVWGY